MLTRSPQRSIANVIFSAAHGAAGRAAAIFELAAGDIRLKHHVRLEDLADLTRKLTTTSEAAPRGVRWTRERGLTPEDAPILAAAVQAGTDMLVTGGSTHFGHLYGKTLRGVEITSPASALARMLE